MKIIRKDSDRVKDMKAGIFFISMHRIDGHTILGDEDDQYG
jgi:hypothetical protein